MIELEAIIERLTSDSRRWQEIASRGIEIERELRIEIERLRYEHSRMQDERDEARRQLMKSRIEKLT